MNTDYDIAIIGGGAAGLMAAYISSSYGFKVLLIEKNDELGKKIAISGGGRCNFTNSTVDSEKYLSSNPNFVKSALAGLPPDTLMAFFADQGLEYIEEDGGKIFCKYSGNDIVKIFTRLLKQNNVKVITNTDINSIEKHDRFEIRFGDHSISSKTLVLATGGMSYKSLGATDFGFRSAEKLGHKIIERGQGLVPLLWSETDRGRFSSLAGVSLEVVLKVRNKELRGGMLFTHNGLSGPVILNASLYWKEKDAIEIDLFPEVDLKGKLEIASGEGERKQISTFLNRWIPRRVADMLQREVGFDDRPVKSYSRKEIERFASALNSWVVKPSSKDSYDRAEVTLGGVDTREISSKNMESRLVEGLYICGELLDVTGIIGGYNLHWAFASGYAAGNGL